MGICGRYFSKNTHCTARPKSLLVYNTKTQSSFCALLKAAAGEWELGVKGPLRKLIKHFDNRGCSHRRKSTASPIIDKVWLYRTPTHGGEEGGYFTCSDEDHLPSRRLGEGEGGVSTL